MLDGIININKPYDEVFGAAQFTKLEIYLLTDISALVELLKISFAPKKCQKLVKTFEIHYIISPKMAYL